MLFRRTLLFVSHEKPFCYVQHFKLVWCYTFGLVVLQISFITHTYAHTHMGLLAAVYSGIELELWIGARFKYLTRFLCLSLSQRTHSPGLVDEPQLFDIFNQLIMSMRQVRHKVDLKIEPNISALNCSKTTRALLYIWVELCSYIIPIFVQPFFAKLTWIKLCIGSCLTMKTPAIPRFLCP